MKKSGSLRLFVFAFFAMSFSASAEERYVVGMQKDKDRKVRQLESALISAVEGKIAELGHNVVSRQEIEAIRKEQGEQLKEDFSEKTRVAPGELQGANRLIKIYASRSGAKCLLTLKLINIENGNIVRSLSDNYSCVSLVSGISGLTERLFGDEKKESGDGYLYFNVDPLDTQYSIDNGKWIGQVTNKNLRLLLPRGKHIVRLYKKGHNEEKREVYISNNPETIKLSLLKQRPKISGKKKCQSGERGLFYVETIPEKAEVFIDGRLAGKSGETFHVGCGTHGVILRKRLYKDYSAEITIMSAADLIKLERIVLESDVGSLLITSEPPGASIYINGVLLDEKTPKQIDNLENKNYQIILSAPFYEGRKKIVLVEAGKIAEVHFDLRPQFNLVRITSEPPGVKVYINENLLGETPLEKRVLRGKYVLRLERELYDTHEEELELPGDGRPVNLSFRLEKDFGTLLVSSDPAAAEIMVDNKIAGLTPNYIKLKAGKHEIEISKDYHDSYRAIIAVERGQERGVNIKLKPHLGTLVFTGIPGALVYLDNESIGTMPVKKELLAGLHQIKIQKGGKSFSEKVMVIKDQIVTLEVEEDQLSLPVAAPKKSVANFSYKEDPDLNDFVPKTKSKKFFALGSLTGLVADLGGFASFMGLIDTGETGSLVSYKVMHFSRILVFLPAFYYGLNRYGVGSCWGADKERGCREDPKKKKIGKSFFWGAWGGMLVTGAIFDIIAYSEIKSREEGSSGLLIFPTSKGLALGFQHRF